MNMIDFESSYLSNLNNFILILAVTIAFYQLLRSNISFLQSFWGYIIIALFAIYNLTLIFSIIHFSKKIEQEPDKNYRPILIIRGIILYSIQIIVTLYIIYDILSRHTPHHIKNLFIK